MAMIVYTVYYIGVIYVVFLSIYEVYARKWGVGFSLMFITVVTAFVAIMWPVWIATWLASLAFESVAYRRHK